MGAHALSFIPEAYHADILAGTSTVDVATYLNNGLSSQRILELPAFGQMSIGSTLFIPSWGGLIGENFGCTIKALSNFGDNPLVRNATQAPTTDAERDQNVMIVGVRLDWNKANNATATEFGHGLALKAVNGARLDVEVVNPHGDGVSIQQSGPGVSEWYQHVGCSHITGKVRTSGCRRQGVAIMCAEQVDLDVYDTGTQLMSVDIEPDHPDNFIRNIFIRLLSLGTGDGSDISGGVCVAGDGLGCIPTGVTVDFEVYEPGGQGAIWRDCKGLTLRGAIRNPGRNGLVGIGGGTGGSQVSFQGVRVSSAVHQGMAARETQGSVYDGEIVVEGTGGIGVQIENARGGVLGLTLKDAGEEGLYLRNTSNMTFHSAVVERSSGHNVWIVGNSSGNRFPFLRSVNSRFGYGFIEDLGCNDNRASFSRVLGNAAGNVSIKGSISSVAIEA